MRLCRFLASSFLVACFASGQQPLQQFRNRNGTFHIDLPAGWRQIAPNEARTIQENGNAPARLGLAQPHHFYAVGPVDAWLAGDFSGPWLYLVEGASEWYLSDDYAQDLTTMWAAEAAASGERHEVTNIQRAKVGTQAVEVIMATRLNTPVGSRPAVQCLDVHSPAGGRQVTFSFSCDPQHFAAHEPTFRSWLQTLTFARLPRGQASLGDRLWGPIVTSVAVGLILLLLYKHSRSRR